MSAILAELAASARTPGHYDRVYKDECMYSFTTPESPGGLYVNMTTFHGVAEEFLPLDHAKSGGRLYLHEKWNRIPLSDEEKVAQSRPTEMAIGVPGGFDPSRRDFKIDKVFAVVALEPSGQPHRFELPAALASLPPAIRASAEGLMAHESAAESDQLEAWTQERQVSKYAADLPQLDNGKVISMDPSTWACEDSGKRENLWLNLSTGYIGSGRPIWDGEKNVGGSGAALKHFEATGRRFPLAVKLGTITPSGADVYSYAPDEDDMVVDPHLRQHLLHWGIDMDRCEKTEKTVQEKEIDLNLAYEFSAITEEGRRLVPASGPGFVGLKNLGNTCYMNSVMQLLGQVTPFAERYAANARALFESAPSAQLVSDLPMQLAKLYAALAKEQGLGAAPTPAGSETVTPFVAPRRLKTLIGRGHAEFSSARQQDAAEYYQHLVDLLAPVEARQGARVGVRSPADLTASLFTFELEQRLLCTASMHVAYKHVTENMLGLMIPMELAAEEEIDDEQGAERETKRPRAAGEGPSPPAKRVIKRVPFQACLDRSIADDLVENYRSAALGGAVTTAAKSTRVSKFPPFLMVQLRRYYVDEATYTAKKLEVIVDVPDHIDLEPLRGKGPQPGEALQPADAADSGAMAGPAGGSLRPDPEIVAALTGMGFSENGCKRACLATKNAGVEACAEWVMLHMEDPDFNQPLSEAELSGGGGAAAAPGGIPPQDPEKLAMLGDMGFAREQCMAALLENGGDTERAANWLFTHMDALDTAVRAAMAKHEAQAPAAPAAAAGSAAVCLDGPARYDLLGFVSHMGGNTSSGHYVAHLRKGGKWYIYNDEKVAESEKPPRGLGYLYLFKRADV